MREQIASVVIPVEQRAAYMDALAQCDDAALAELFRSLSAAEEERIEVFAQA